MPEKPTILIVDDDLPSQQVLTFYAETMGAQAEILIDGIHIVDYILQHQPTVIIVDLKLPYKDAWEILREIQNHPQTSSSKVIMISASWSQELAVKASEAGFLHTFPKPVNRQEFVSVLSKLVA